MIFNSMKFFSEALGMCTEAYVLIPQRGTTGRIGDNAGQSGPGKFKCLYLLHGLSDDQSIWMRRTSIERYAEEYGIAVVMPFGEKSFYTDTHSGMNFYTYIAKELPARIADTFNISVDRQDNFVAGLSMGGYGALKIGLRENSRFAACAGLSPLADIKEWTSYGYLDAVFGPERVVPDTDDLFELAKMKADDPERPKVFMAIGYSDALYDMTKRLAAEFRRLNYDFTYMESEGVHDWAFWDKYIKEVLAWFKKEKLI